MRMALVVVLPQSVARMVQIGSGMECFSPSGGEGARDKGPAPRAAAYSSTRRMAQQTGSSPFLLLLVLVLVLLLLLVLKPTISTKIDRARRSTLIERLIKLFS